MCLLRSEESLACAANTTFCPQKTTDILNNPQRHKGHTKKGTMQTLTSFKKKRIQNLPPVIDRSHKKVAPLSSLRSKRFRAVSEQRTRNESQRPHEKWSEYKVDLWGLGRGCERIPCSRSSLRACDWRQWRTKTLVGFWTSDYLVNNPKNCSTKW